MLREHKIKKKIFREPGKITPENLVVQPSKTCTVCSFLDFNCFLHFDLSSFPHFPVFNTLSATFLW